MSEKKEITHQDFEKLGLDLKKELLEIAGRLESRIDKHLANIKYWCVGGVILFCVIFSWLFDYKFDLTNNQNQAHFEKLDSAVFISKNDAILKAIQDLQTKIDNSNTTQKKNRQKKRW